MKRCIIRKPNAFVLKCILLLSISEFFLERFQEHLNSSYMTSLGIVRSYNIISLGVSMTLPLLLLLPWLLLSRSYNESKLNILAKIFGIPIVIALLISCISHMIFFINLTTDIEQLKEQRFRIESITLDDIQEIQEEQGTAVLYIGRESCLSCKETLEGLKELAADRTCLLYTSRCV